jgi:hypothetical protein
MTVEMGLMRKLQWVVCFVQFNDPSLLLVGSSRKKAVRLTAVQPELPYQAIHPACLHRHKLAQIPLKVSSVLGALTRLLELEWLPKMQLPGKQVLRQRKLTESNEQNMQMSLRL